MCVCIPQKRLQMISEVKKMNEEKKSKLRIRLNTVDKVILIILVVLMVLMAALSIMSRFGLMLINGAAYIFGGFAGLVILLGWGGYALVRLFKSRTTRMVMGTLVAVVIFILVVISVTFISMFATISIPTEFDTVVNGDRKVVILKGYDVDEERMKLRFDERAKQNPGVEITESTEDYGYCYYAYPKVLGIFYRADADAEGEVYIGQNSEATLMIEWTDENTAHLFVDNPGVGDGGDWYLRY